MLTGSDLTHPISFPAPIRQEVSFVVPYHQGVRLSRWSLQQQPRLNGMIDLYLRAPAMPNDSDHPA